MPANPYPARVKARAIALHAEGHNPTAIARILRAELRPAKAPERTTIRLWVDEAANDRHRARDAANQLLRRQEAQGRQRDTIDRDMLVLRRAGVSYRAIAIAIAHFHDVRLQPETIRHRCRDLGAPPKPHGSPFGSRASA